MVAGLAHFGAFRIVVLAIRCALLAGVGASSALGRAVVCGFLLLRLHNRTENQKTQTDQEIVQHGNSLTLQEMN
jgi:hypothetical protein